MNTSRDTVVEQIEEGQLGDSFGTVGTTSKSISRDMLGCFYAKVKKRMTAY
jgi:hypothetical protein